MREPSIPPTHALSIAVVCFVLALICFGLLLSGCASSRIDQGLNVAIVGSGIADVITTRQALESGRGEEGNPAMPESLLGQAVMKGLGIGTVIGVTYLGEKKHPVLTRVLRVACLSVWSAVALRNYQVNR